MYVQPTAHFISPLGSLLGALNLTYPELNPLSMLPFQPVLSPGLHPLSLCKSLLLSPATQGENPGVIFDFFFFFLSLLMLHPSGILSVLPLEYIQNPLTSLCTSMHSCHCASSDTKGATAPLDPFLLLPHCRLFSASHKNKSDHSILLFSTIPLD